MKLMAPTGAVCLSIGWQEVAVLILVMARPIVSMAEGAYPVDGVYGSIADDPIYNHLSFDGGPVCDGQRWMWVGGRKKAVRWC